VELTNTWGCKSAARGEAGLTIKGLPRVYFTATRACESWTEFGYVEPAGGAFSGWGCTPDGKFAPAEMHQGTAVVTCSYTAPNGCASHATQDVEIVRLPNTPTVTVNGQPATAVAVCPGSMAVPLKTSVAVSEGSEYSTSYTYQWRMDGFDIPGEVALDYVATKKGAYAVRVCNQGLCWAAEPSAPVAVTQLPPPAPRPLRPQA
jgi:hypothetical protein